MQTKFLQTLLVTAALLAPADSQAMEGWDSGGDRPSTTQARSRNALPKWPGPTLTPSSEQLEELREKGLPTSLSMARVVYRETRLDKSRKQHSLDLLRASLPTPHSKRDTRIQRSYEETVFHLDQVLRMLEGAFGGAVKVFSEARQGRKGDTNGSGGEK